MAKSSADQLEDGEIEDGELPASQEAKENDSKPESTAPGKDSTAPPSGILATNGLPSQARGQNIKTYPTRDPEFPPYENARLSPHLSPHASPRLSPRYSSRVGSYRSDPLDRPHSSREREVVLSNLRDLTRHITIQDALRPNVGLENVSYDIIAAIKKLDKLWKSLKRGRQLNIESDPECADCADRIFKGLRAVHAVSGTGAGRVQNLDAAKEAMRTAWQFQSTVFTGNQRKELDSWIRTSKIFREVLGELQSNTEQHPEPGELEQGEIHPVDQQPSADVSRPALTSVAYNPDSTDQLAVDSGEGRRKRQKVDSSPAAASEDQQHAPRADGADQANGHTDIHLSQTPSEQDISPTAAPAALPANPGGHSSSVLQSVSNNIHARMQPAATAPTTAPPTPPPLPTDETDADMTLLQEDVHSLISAGRLCLVLDLDHTLLNSVRFSDVDPSVTNVLQRRVEHESSLPLDQRELFSLPHINTWTKLRPGVRNFLATAHRHFELWIHTNGNRVYAHAMAALLDPSQEYFGNRIIAQGSAGQDESSTAAQITKRLMAGLEGRESIAIIVDDTEAVWPHDRRNLFVVERYIYFPAAARQFGIQGSCLFEIGRDECPKTGMLATALDVFMRVHTTVFRHMEGVTLPNGERKYPSWDVRNVLSEERGKVLQGCSIVFTRVIPLEQPPHTHKVWLMAEAFGATCSLSLSNETTHVVAGSKLTDKARWAEQHGKHVVALGWLECSCTLWRRASEDLFGLTS